MLMTNGKAYVKNRGLIAPLKVKYIITPGDGDNNSDDKKQDYKPQFQLIFK